MGRKRVGGLPLLLVCLVCLVGLPGALIVLCGLPAQALLLPGALVVQPGPEQRHQQPHAAVAEVVASLEGLLEALQAGHHAVEVLGLGHAGGDGALVDDILVGEVAEGVVVEVEVLGLLDVDRGQRGGGRDGAGRGVAAPLAGDGAGALLAGALLA